MVWNCKFCPACASQSYIGHERAQLGSVAVNHTVSRFSINDACYKSEARSVGIFRAMQSVVTPPAACRLPSSAAAAPLFQTGVVAPTLLFRRFGLAGADFFSGFPSFARGLFSAGVLDSAAAGFVAGAGALSFLPVDDR